MQVDLEPSDAQCNDPHCESHETQRVFLYLATPQRNPYRIKVGDFCIKHRDQLGRVLQAGKIAGSMLMPKLTHEFDATGRHRISVDGRAGEWAIYSHPAFSRDIFGARGTALLYIALTGYWGSREHYFKCEAVSAELKEIES